MWWGALVASTLLLSLCGLMICSLCCWIAWGQCMRRREAARLRREIQDLVQDQTISHLQVHKPRRQGSNGRAEAAAVEEVGEAKVYIL